MIARPLPLTRQIGTPLRIIWKKYPVFTTAVEKFLLKMQELANEAAGGC